MAAVGWGTWDFWQHRRLLFMKRVLARRTSKAEDAVPAARQRFVAQAAVDGKEGEEGEEGSAVLSFVNLRGVGIHFSQVAGVQLVSVEDVVLDRLVVTNHGG